MSTPGCQVSNEGELTYKELLETLQELRKHGRRLRDLPVYTDKAWVRKLALIGCLEAAVSILEELAVH